MRRNVFLRLCALLACGAVFIGCASKPPVTIDQIAPVAIVSVMSDNNITWYGDKPESKGLLGNLLEKTVDSKIGENTEKLLPAAEKALINAFNAKGIELIDSAKVVNSPAYLKASEDKLAKNSGMIVPASYRFVTAKDAKFLEALAAETGLKTGMYVTFLFEKKMSNGVMKNGTAKACVSASVMWVGTNGKVVKNDTYYVSSNEPFPVVGGVYDVKTLMNSYPELINKICGDIATSL